MKYMVYIVWNKNNDLGIPIIDEQHRGIVSTINTLYYFMQRGRGEDAIKPTISILNQYIKTHFITEEELMKESEYPAFDAHLKLHTELDKRMKDISSRLDHNADAETILNFLKDWWLNHINVEDRKYIPYLVRYLGI